METSEINHYLYLLKEEKGLLERELGSVGRKNSDIPGEWEASLNEKNTETAEVEGRAEEIHEFEDRNAVEIELAHRFHQVTKAIESITDGTYGICTICGINIEKERLNANPAAHTCKTHRES